MFSLWGNALARRIEVGQVVVHDISKQQLLLTIESSLANEHGLSIVTPNLQFNQVIRKFGEIAELVESADLAICDSRFLQLIIKIGYNEHLERLSGASVFEWVLDLASSKNADLAIIGGSKSAHSSLKIRIESEFSGIPSATFFDGEISLPPTSTELSAVNACLNTTKPQIVILALGFPKQEYLAQVLRAKYPETIFLSLGAGIDYSSGLKVRAPLIIQMAGLEWLWRLISEPRRLFRRYVVDGFPEAAYLLVWAMRKRLGSRTK